MRKDVKITQFLGDFKLGAYEPEISLAKGMAKVECEGHPLVKFL
jgi:hypothetical protein